MREIEKSLDPLPIDLLSSTIAKINKTARETSVHHICYRIQIYFF